MTQLMPSPGAQRLALASYYAQHRRTDDARRCYRQVPPLEEVQMPRSVRLLTYAQYCEAAAAAGDVAGAASAYRLLLPSARFHIASGAAALLTRGSAHRFLGVAAAASGKTDTAITHLRAAVVANAEAGLTPFEGQAQYLLAELLHHRRQPGDDSEATQLALDAQATAARLGMPHLYDQASILLRTG
jgi:hypothetical protein